MKKMIYPIFVLVTAAALFTGCRIDEPDENSLFVTPESEKSSFDVWLDENYVDTYNIRLAYRLEDVETDFKYNVVPADLMKSKQMAILMKHLWIEAYEEVAGEGIHFVRATIPKLLHLIGSPEYTADGVTRLGLAEGGLKITITDVNSLDPYNVMNQYYFGTMHHEFAHVLHQTIAYPTEFEQISALDYAATTWINRSKESQYLPLGFITSYAGSKPQEDFAEVIARYVTYSHDKWNGLLETAGEEGRAKIEKKLGIVRAYLKTNWSVDIDKLYEVVQRRAGEIKDMDLYNLDF